MAFRFRVIDLATGEEEYLSSRVPFLGYVARQTLSISGGNIDYDIALGVKARVTLTANATLLDPVDGPGDPADGVSGGLLIIQDGTGGWTLAKPTNMTMAAGDFADIGGMAASAKAFLAWESIGGGNTLGWLTVL